MTDDQETSVRWRDSQLQPALRIQRRLSSSRVVLLPAGGGADFSLLTLDLQLFCVRLNINLVFVGPLPRVRPRNGILGLVLVVVVLVVVLVPLRSEFIGEL